VQDIELAEAVQTREGETGDTAQRTEDHFAAGGPDFVSESELAPPAVERVAGASDIEQDQPEAEEALQDLPQSAEPSKPFAPSSLPPPVDTAAVEDTTQPVSEGDEARESSFEDAPAALEDASAAPAETGPAMSEAAAPDAEQDLEGALLEPQEKPATVADRENVLQSASPLETEARDAAPAVPQEDPPEDDPGERAPQTGEPALWNEEFQGADVAPAFTGGAGDEQHAREVGNRLVPAEDGPARAADVTSALHEAPEPEAVPPSEDTIWSRPEDHAPQPPPEPEATPQHTDARRPAEAGADLVLWRHQEAVEEPPAAEPQPNPAGILHAAAPAVAAVLQPSADTTAPSPAAGLGVFRYLRLAVRAAVYGIVGYTLLVLVLLAAYRWVDPPFSNLMLTQRLMGWQVEQKWVPLTRISPNLVQAVILSEDGGFCRHQGVDWVAIEEAIEEARGGSTITMQVVKNLFLWSSRSYIRKAIEIPLALLMEMLWPKQRILEVYLNIAEWGDGVFGAEAAAQHHFRKRAAQLSAQEAALLAVSLPNPIERQAGDPGAQTRRLANNLMLRMKAVRTSMTCVRSARFAW
jgi:monofunctional biosynthetic peptidoglycan transglycosylase